MLNIAVIGAGKLGEFHIKLLKTSTKFNLVGFHEKNKERLTIYFLNLPYLFIKFSDNLNILFVLYFSSFFPSDITIIYIRLIQHYFKFFEVLQK